jgi:glycosyltransferase involved in cell wall biosynthesis
MLRILFIAPSAYLLGGVQDWLYMTCLGLRKEGHKVVVGVPNGKFHDAKRYNRLYSGLEAVSFTNKSGTREGRIRGLSSFLLRNKCDIIVGVNIGDLYQSYIRVAEKLGETKFVIALHAIETNYFLDIKKYAPLIDGVITTNRLPQSMVQSLADIERNRVFYAACGIDTSIIDQRDIDDKEINRINIAWVGRIESNQKRVMDLVRVVRRLDLMGVRFKLSVAGEGPDKEKLRNAMEQWIEIGIVELKGAMKREDLYRFYRENEVLLITSEWETGPIIAWEAMAAGLVVVSSKYIGSRLEGALIDGQTALLYEIGNDVDAAKKLSSVYNPVIRNGISEKAREVVKERYLQEHSIAQWEKSLREIANWKKKNWSHYELAMRKESLGLGRLERMLGHDVAEKLRYVIPARQATDAGDEWPHSCHEITDQSRLWQHARNIENGEQADWDYNL